ncbi:MAG: CocE/NonD family hydrolase [Microthrixaceae bacterium]
MSRGRRSTWSAARTVLVAVVALAGVLLAAGCSALPSVEPPPPPPGVGPALPPAGLLVRGGVEQVYVTGATPGTTVRLEGLAGAVPSAAEIPVDRLGSAVFRKLTQGSTYRVTETATGATRDVRVLVFDEHPPRQFYERTTLSEGLNYLPTRDGTTLAAVVRPPVGRSLSDGPFPTLIEYSGYSVGAPQDPVAEKVAGLLDPGRTADPLAPGSETFVGGVVARLAGYAVVSVQMRGSGCSGGEADLFDLPGALDGYDAVEGVAAQDWVLGGRVGMIGISFSGYSQLPTAGTRPPHLAAIVPLSFLGRVWDVGRPGGIFNTGFAESWLAERVATARPAPDPGALPYANALVTTDERCRRNQELRLQTRDGNGIFRDTVLNTEDYERRNFEQWYDRIDVPVFGSLQFQDEQTSSYAMIHVDRLLRSDPLAKMHLSSGEHTDSVSPDTLVDIFQFLDIYVAGHPPEPKLGLYLAQSLIFGQNSAPLPFPDLWGRDLAGARAGWEARPRVTVGVERARGESEGASGTRWTFPAASFPAPGSTLVTRYLGPGGTLATAPAAAAAQDSYRSDPAARPARSLPEWSSPPDGTSLGFTSEPFANDTVIAGPIAADLWLGSTAADTDVQVTVTEVRADGREQFVTTGVQRASFRTVRPGPTAIDDAVRPDIDFTDQRPLAPGLNRVRLQVMPAAWALRAGSRLRVVVGPVGGERTAWRYDPVDRAAPPLNTIGLGGATASAVSYLTVPAAAPAGDAPCPARGQPCRTYRALPNGG